MVRFILVFLLGATLLPAAAQQKATIQILHADYFIPETKNARNKLLGNVKLQHRDMLMTCDSLYQYADSNYIEAFGRVHAVQNDTLNLWGDFMTYDGNTEMAKVRRNVVMQDPQITLTTNFLDYDSGKRIGHYFNSGTIKDSINTLVSDIGYYYQAINEMFFKDSVKVYTPDYTMYSDTLKYQTERKIITILGPTHILGENRTLYSENGWYNSLTSHAELYKNNRLTYGDYQGRADTIVVDSVTNSAIMRQHIHLYDTVNKVIVEGNHGEVLKNNDYAYVTQRALLIFVGQKDSLFVHGDTLSISKDTLGNDVMKAYHHTKFYSLDLQGVCDSMVFPAADSTVYLFTAPAVWASDNQMTAEVISMHLKDNEVDQFHLKNKAMIVNQMDSTKYNQIKGRNMTGYIRNNELYLVNVDGNGEVIYYPDDQGIVIGLNKTSSSNIKIYLQQKKVQDIIFINKPEGSLNPLFLVKPEERYLQDFQWRIAERPRNKEAIFHWVAPRLPEGSASKARRGAAKPAPSSPARPTAPDNRPPRANRPARR